MEQEQIEENEEIEEIEEVEENEDDEKIIPVRKLSRKKYNPDYHTPEFIEKLGTYYVTSQNYAETARRLNEDFGTHISKDQVKYIYIQKMARKVTLDQGANAFFNDAFKRMKERWEDAWDMVGDLVKQYKILRKQLGEEEDTQKAMMMMKMAPTVLQISEGIRKQLEFIQNQQEQIKIQQETLIFSPTQISQQISSIMKKLINERKIAVLKDIPEWEIEKLDKKDGKK